MKQIRKSMFETNSSSMHSIVVTSEEHLLAEKDLFAGNYYGKNFYKDICLDDNGLWYFCKEDLDFGTHPFRILCTLKEKTAYAIASLCSYQCDAENTIERMEEIIETVVPDFKGFRFDKETYEDEGEEHSYDIYGGVDHQSYMLLQNVLWEEDITLEDFLLNEKYWVIIDSDDQNDYRRLMEHHIINSNIMVKRYSGWGEEPVAYDKSTNFGLNYD